MRLRIAKPLFTMSEDVSQFHGLATTKIKLIEWVRAQRNPAKMQLI
jgi:hypothetical protein